MGAVDRAGEAGDVLRLVVRRVLAIFALLAVLGLGSGAFGHLHRLQHEYKDAHGHHHHAGHRHHHDHPQHGGQEDDGRPEHHDETNCHLHAMLRAPLMSGGWVPLLVGLGVLVAFLTMLPGGIEGRNAPARIDCRGPPGR